MSQPGKMFKKKQYKIYEASFNFGLFLALHFSHWKNNGKFLHFKSEILDFGLACDEMERNFLNSHCPVSIIYLWYWSVLLMIILYTHALCSSAYNEFFGVKIQDLFILIPYSDYSDIFLKAGSYIFSVNELKVLICTCAFNRVERENIKCMFFIQCYLLSIYYIPKQKLT